MMLQPKQMLLDLVAWLHLKETQQKNVSNYFGIKTVIILYIDTFFLKYRYCLVLLTTEIRTTCFESSTDSFLHQKSDLITAVNSQRRGSHDLIASQPQNLNFNTLDLYVR